MKKIRELYYWWSLFLMLWALILLPHDPSFSAIPQLDLLFNSTICCCHLLLVPRSWSNTVPILDVLPKVLPKPSINIWQSCILYAQHGIRQRPVCGIQLDKYPRRLFLHGRRTNVWVISKSHGSVSFLYLVDARVVRTQWKYLVEISGGGSAWDR